MKRYGNLWPQVTAFANLLAAAKQAQRGKRFRDNVLQFAAIVEECEGDFTKIFAWAKKCERKYQDRLVTQPLPKKEWSNQAKPVLPLKPDEQQRPGMATVLNVKAIRTQTGLSQSQLATLMGISVRTLQNWETGRRQPQGPALALLTVFQKATEPAVNALIQRIN